MSHGAGSQADGVSLTSPVLHAPPVLTAGKSEGLPVSTQRFEQAVLPAWEPRFSPPPRDPAQLRQQRVGMAQPSGEVFSFTNQLPISQGSFQYCNCSNRCGKSLSESQG